MNHPAECKYWREPEDQRVKQAGICVGGFHNAPSFGICNLICKNREIEPGKLESYREKRRNDAMVSVTFPNRPSKPPEPSQGVGTEIKRILSSMGISSCGSCVEKAKEYDDAGLAWCQEHRQEIIDHLIAQGKAKGWIMGVAAKASASTIVDMAIAARERQIQSGN